METPILAYVIFTVSGKESPKIAPYQDYYFLQCSLSRLISPPTFWRFGLHAPQAVLKTLVPHSPAGPLGREGSQLR